MNYNFLNRFFNQLTRNKLYTIVNIFGFAISVMFVILLSVYIQQELSVDQFHAKKDRIYRLTSERWAGFSPPVGKWLKNTYPELENFSRVFEQTGIINDIHNNKFSLEYLLVDTSFFKMFSFNILEGDKKRIFETKNSIVLTKDFADKLFGDSLAIGKSVTFNDRMDFIVTGIAENLPENTHFKKCDAFVNFPALEDIWGARGLMENFGNCSFSLYLLEKENSNLPARKQDILDMFMKEFWLYKGGYAHELRMEPLVDCYFSEVPGSGKTSNDKTFVNVLAVIVLVILIISLINYINLTIAQSGARNKEIATKMMLGSTKVRLFARFILESTLLCFIAFFVALILSIFAEPVFNYLLDTNIHLTQKLSFTFILFIISIIIGIGFISGLVPAFVITRINPIEVFKGTFQAKRKMVYSKSLIAFQFCVVIILLICTWIIVRQTKFARDYDTGFDKNNILAIENTIPGDRKEAFKGELFKIPGVEQVVFVAGSPLDGGNNLSFNYHDMPLSFQIFTVDTNFFNMFGMEITETGVAYSKDGIWLNETAVKETGLDKLPTHFKDFNNEPPILGVVKDFNFRDLHQKIGPAMVRQLEENRYAWQILIKISDKNILETVNNIKSTYNDFTDGLPLNMSFVDETMNQWYEKEVKTSRIVGYFAILAIIISILGILAMSLYYIQQKIKEIGIRKVNGARSKEIVLMLNTDFIMWVIVAFIIACPIAWYAMNRWLENFAYKTNIHWWIFAVSGITTMILALLTISLQCWHASNKNPVEALRYE